MQINSTWFVRMNPASLFICLHVTSLLPFSQDKIQALFKDIITNGAGYYTAPH